VRQSLQSAEPLASSKLEWQIGVATCSVALPISLLSQTPRSVFQRGWSGNAQRLVPMAEAAMQTATSF
jgi:hypothetical protein